MSVSLLEQKRAGRQAEQQGDCRKQREKLFHRDYLYLSYLSEFEFSKYGEHQ